MLGKNWEELKKIIDKKNEDMKHHPPLDVLKVFHYEVVSTEAGAYKNLMGVWLDGATSSRYLGAYYTYNIIKITEDEKLSVDQLKLLVDTLLPDTISKVHYCGLCEYASLTADVIDCIHEMSDLQQMLSLLNSIYLYGSSMNAWIHHYMKWSIGNSYKINDKKHIDGLVDRRAITYR